MNKILNIAGYKFISLPPEKLSEWRDLLKNQASLGELKGTILLSQEGINLFLAGNVRQITDFQNFLQNFSQFKELSFRQSWSEAQPFKRLLVKIKKEIIAMGQPEIQPEKSPAPYIEPTVLREWFQQQRPMVILDTRNEYEINCGSFQDAVHLGLKNFRSFSQAVENLPPEAKQLPIVTFCTGGIRCEKAALWLQKMGYPQVYQLQGGILNYFEQCGSEYFHGECFVFDDRASIDSIN